MERKEKKREEYLSHTLIESPILGIHETEEVEYFTEKPQLRISDSKINSPIVNKDEPIFEMDLDESWSKPTKSKSWKKLNFADIQSPTRKSPSLKYSVPWIATPNEMYLVIIS